MSCYRGYHGQSIGRVLHFLEHYCGLHVAEHAQVGDSRVTLHGQPFATFHFFGDVPRFEFENPHYNVEQAARRAEAIDDGRPEYPGRVSPFLRNCAECFLAIGDAGPCDALINSDNRSAHFRAFATATSRAAQRLSVWITGMTEGIHPPASDYIAACKAGSDAMGAIGKP